MVGSVRHSGNGVATEPRDAKKKHAHAGWCSPQRGRVEVFRTRARCGIDSARVARVVRPARRLESERAGRAEASSGGENPRAGPLRDPARWRCDDGRERTAWRCLASPLRLEVFEVKTDPAPLRCPRMIRPILDDG